MKKIIRNSLFLSLLFFLLFIIPFTALANGDLVEKTVTYNGIVLSGLLNDFSKYEVSVFLKKYKSNEGSKKIDHQFWGVDGELPENIIDKMSLMIGGKDVPFPSKAFDDLSNIILPTGIYLMQKDNAVVLYLKGGDGAGAYTAVFEILHNKLIRRTIQFVNSEGELDTAINNY